MCDRCYFDAGSPVDKQRSPKQRRYLADYTTSRCGAQKRRMRTNKPVEKGQCTGAKLDLWTRRMVVKKIRTCNTTAAKCEMIEYFSQKYIVPHAIHGLIFDISIILNDTYICANQKKMFLGKY